MFFALSFLLIPLACPDDDETSVSLDSRDLLSEQKNADLGLGWVEGWARGVA